MELIVAYINHDIPFFPQDIILQLIFFHVADESHDACQDFLFVGEATYNIPMSSASRGFTPTPPNLTPLYRRSSKVTTPIHSESSPSTTTPVTSTRSRHIVTSPKTVRASLAQSGNILCGGKYHPAFVTSNDSVTLTFFTDGSGSGLGFSFFAWSPSDAFNCEYSI